MPPTEKNTLACSEEWHLRQEVKKQQSKMIYYPNGYVEGFSLNIHP